MPRAPVYPKGLAVRGKRLWKETLEIRPRLGPGEKILLEEACRLSDRLEALNGIIVGSEHPEFETKDGERYVVVVDAAQQEARLATVALRQVMMSLGLDKLAVPVPVEPPAPPAPKPEPAEDDEEKGGDPLDEITRRRQRRERPAG
jgi:hypothetical protein